MSLPFLKKMKSWQNLWHLSLKYWWSVRPKSKKTGRNVFFWEKAKLSDSLLVVSSSKCSAVLKFRNIIKWQTVTPCDIKSMVLIRVLEKEMATHCSVLAWRIPWTEESGGLQSVGSQRVRGHLATKQSGGNTTPRQHLATSGDVLGCHAKGGSCCDTRWVNPGGRAEPPDPQGRPSAKS